MAVVETERLILRPWRKDDIDAVADLFANPDVFRFPFGRGLTREEAETFLDRHVENWKGDGFSYWAAELRDAPGLIGFVGLSTVRWLPEVQPAVELGYRFHPAYWGRGLASEGGRAALRFGFESLGLDRIIAVHDPANVASGRVMARLGMWPCGQATDPTFRTPLHVREITASAWRMSRCPGGGEDERLTRAFGASGAP